MTLLEKKSDGSETAISQFFINANINFCKKATLNIRTCNIGKLDSIKEKIEKYYAGQGKDVEVNVYSYYIFPSGIPNFATYTLRFLLDFIKDIGKGAGSIYG